MLSSVLTAYAGTAGIPAAVSANEAATSIIVNEDRGEDEGHNVSGKADAPEKGYSYTTDTGLQIISYVDTWQEDKLKLIAGELMLNKHGLEMEYLDRIEIHPGAEPGGNEQVVAHYEKERKEISVPLKLAGFLPADYELKIPVEKGVIRIYKGEEREKVEDLASDLSHEYGHHYTFFHFGKEFSPENYKESTYYKVRGLEDYPLVNGEYSYEEDIHRWSIFEIAAEDYYQLLGSNTGKKTTRFLDISQKTGGATYQPVNLAGREDYNALPQENWNIPLAAQVPGLRQYFLSFLEDTDAGAVPVLQSDGTVNLSRIELPGLSYIQEEHYGFKKYIIKWNKLSVEGLDEPVYTLVAYDREENRVIPVKTVYPGEKTRAVVGTVTEVVEPYIYYYQDGLDKGELEFRLLFQFPDGQILSGEPLIIDFGGN